MQSLQDLARGKDIAQGFAECSGFHTLEQELEYIKAMDKSGDWKKGFDPFGVIIAFWTQRCTGWSLVPGKTKIHLMAALLQGTERQRETYMESMKTVSTLSGLFLTSTIPLSLSPPLHVLNPRPCFEWVPYVYAYSLAMSVGFSMGLIAVCVVFQGIPYALSVRDADWLRMMSRGGDAAMLWSMLAFSASLFSLVVAIGSAWASTVVGPDNAWGLGGTLLGIYLLCLAPVVGFSRMGALDCYWMDCGHKYDDTTDLDPVIKAFEHKIMVAKQLREADSTLHQIRKAMPAADENAKGALNWALDGLGMADEASGSELDIEEMMATYASDSCTGNVAMAAEVHGSSFGSHTSLESRTVTPLSPQTMDPQLGSTCAAGALTPAYRLRILKDLHDQGLIDLASFQTKRDEILASF